MTKLHYTIRKRIKEKNKLSTGKKVRHIIEVLKDCSIIIGVISLIINFYFNWIATPIKVQLLEPTSIGKSFLEIKTGFGEVDSHLFSKGAFLGVSVKNNSDKMLTLNNAILKVDKISSKLYYAPILVYGVVNNRLIIYAVNNGNKSVDNPTFHLKFKIQNKEMNTPKSMTEDQYQKYFNVKSFDYQLSSFDNGDVQIIYDVLLDEKLLEIMDDQYGLQIDMAADGDIPFQYTEIICWWENEFRIRGPVADAGAGAIPPNIIFEDLSHEPETYITKLDPDAIITSKEIINTSLIIVPSYSCEIEYNISFTIEDNQEISSGTAHTVSIFVPRYNIDSSNNYDAFKGFQEHKSTSLELYLLEKYRYNREQSIELINHRIENELIK